ncbi:MAG: class I SAM-dependent methyltransferase [Dehalococcoidales bacterium]|nr:class I SAM-dependent methyltransferase [Dehalococcoidales bacterium]
MSEEECRVPQEFRVKYDPEAWEKHAPGYAELLNTRDEPRHYGLLLNTIAENYVPGMRMLEVGCAGGSDYRFLNCRKFIEDYTGVDITPSYIQEARGLYPEATWIIGDARDLPFKDKWFDITMCFLMLLHLDKEGVRAALNEMCRVTKSLVFVHTFAASKRYDGTDIQHHLYCYNVIALDELKVDGWETIQSLDGDAPRVTKQSNLAHIPEDVFYEFMLRRI